MFLIITSKENQKNSTPYKLNRMLQQSVLKPKSISMMQLSLSVRECILAAILNKNLINWVMIGIQDKLVALELIANSVKLM
jgi:hypothetical protein